MASEMIVAELLCTRLCHDITGPIGAVSNGVEFLAEEEADMQGQAIELIRSSAQEAVARLQFYRYAYGKINDQEESLLEDKKKLVADFFSGGRITLDWQEYSESGGRVTLSGAMTRILFNMLIIASATLLKGGKLSIHVECGADGRKMEVAATGPMIKWENDMKLALEGKMTDALTPKTVQFYMTQQLAEHSGATIMVDAAAERFAIITTEKTVHCAETA